MDWVHTKRGGQSFTDQTPTSVSAPPLPLMAVFAIVIFLLSLSQYNSYKEQMRHTLVGFKILLFFVPVILVVFMRSSLLVGGGWRLNWRSPPPHGRRMWADLARGMAGFPWGVGVLVVVLLLLVSYQSSFQSKFGSSHY